MDWAFSRSGPASPVLVIALSVVLLALVLAGCDSSTPAPKTAGPRTSQPALSTPAPTMTLNLGNNITMDLVLIPAGKFMMGSPASERDRFVTEGPVREVTIRRPLYMGRTEVTQAQWQAVMGNNPSAFKGDAQLPVESVSWEDCQKFCQTLSQMTGRSVRLPSEPEWEYACRAGSTTRFSFGDDPDYSKLPEYAWFNVNGGKGTHPVGQKKPNPWGLHDMHGNLSEWCQDVWHDDYSSAPTDGSAWMVGGKQDYRVVRAGSWNNRGRNCRSAGREGEPPDDGGLYVGVRVVVDSGTP